MKDFHTIDMKQLSYAILSAKIDKIKTISKFIRDFGFLSNVEKGFLQNIRGTRRLSSQNMTTLAPNWENFESNSTKRKLCK